MCLINLHYNDHPTYKLIIAANRDEFYQRPTASAHFWKDEPNILAGRDLVEMGTWLGISRQGRFAALTNFRNPKLNEAAKISRGEIVRQYLASNTPTAEFLEELKITRNNYAGYNIIFGNADELFHFNNILDEENRIGEGTHALSNHTLDTPWPKVRRGKKMLHDYVIGNSKIETDALFKIISNAEIADDKELPQTGVGIELERMLSPLFIKMPEYGTRSSTVLLVDHQNHVTFAERTYVKGELLKEETFSFQLN
ncbi:NRDE family protein [Oceanobacillus chungangensis]|uniref:NRDE family protein n=1 Tax=Oceanobacillus chungangensis TaxID=1229152 RepID=A0A3D8PUI6_9BACI|nr:NRDE family protein [Oceanobacillus chungangensis]RDW19783.1 hypothetical protein CWR45_06860 [Oceanobacillus chungangensis]